MCIKSVLLAMYCYILNMVYVHFHRRGRVLYISISHIYTYCAGAGGYYLFLLEDLITNTLVVYRRPTSGQLDILSRWFSVRRNGGSRYINFVNIVK